MKFSLNLHKTDIQKGPLFDILCNNDKNNILILFAYYGGRKLKKVVASMLVAITLLGTIPIKSMAKEVSSQAGSLIEDNTGSLVSSEENVVKDNRKDDEVVLKSAEEPHRDKKQSEPKPETKEEVKNTPPASPEVPNVTQRIENAPKGDVLREIIKNYNPKIIMNEQTGVENNKVVSFEENLIQSSKNFQVETIQTANGILTTKLEYQIVLDENGNPSHILWIYKTKLDREDKNKVNLKVDYITVSDMGLGYPLIIEEETNPHVLEDQNLNPYTNITYSDINSQIEKLRENQNAKIQATTQTVEVGELVSQTIIKTPIVRAQKDYTLVINTGQNTGNIIRTYTVGVNGSQHSTGGQLQGILEGDKIIWEKIYANTTNTEQIVQINLTPDEAQKLTKKITANIYRPTEEGYIEKVEGLSNLKGTLSEKEKIDILEKLSENQISRELKTQMTTYGIFKLAVEQLEKQAEALEEQLYSTEDIPQILQAESVDVVENTNVVENESSAENAEETKESLELAKLIQDRLNYLNEIRLKIQTDTIKTVKLEPGEIIVAEIETQIVDSKPEYKVPGGVVLAEEQSKAPENK